MTSPIPPSSLHRLSSALARLTRIAPLLLTPRHHAHHHHSFSRLQHRLERSSFSTSALRPSSNRSAKPRTDTNTTMLADLRILTVPAHDTPSLPPLVVQLGADRYLFNVGESTSRSCTQRKANLSRVTNIFVPHTAWNAIGGLPGVLMSQADGNRTSSHLYGPPNLRYALATMRTYAKRDTMQLHLNEFAASPSASASDAAPAPFFQDHNVVVHAVQLMPFGFSAAAASSQQHCQAQRQIAKKPRLDIPTTDAQTYDEESIAAATASIQASWKKPSWNPSKLRGNEAQAWIRLVSDSLFNDSLLEKRRRANEQGVAIADLDTEVQFNATRGKPPRTPAFVVNLLPAPSADLIVPAQAGGQEAGGQAPVLAFVCEAHAQRGKFDPAKAVEAGVGPGPDFARLTRGEDVVISLPKSWAHMDAEGRKKWADSRRSAQSGGKRFGAKKKHAKGKDAAAPTEPKPEPAEWADVEDVTIRSQDVVGPSRAGAVFFQIYLPSASYIPSLLSAESDRRFQPYTTSASADKPAEQRRTPHAIVHAVPLEVLRDRRYQEWMARFGPDCNHLVCNDDVCANKLMFPSSSTIPLRLSKLDDQLFQVPQYQLQPRVSLDEVRAQSDVLSSLRLFSGEADQLVQLHPRGPPRRHRSGAPDFDFTLGSDEAEQMASFQLEVVKESEEQRAHTDKLKAKNSKAAKDKVSDKASGSSEQGSVGEAKVASDAAGLGLARQGRLQEARKKAWADYLDAVATTKQRRLQVEPDAASVVAPCDDVLITTLGTGSAAPSKYRNVISTLIQTPHDGNVLLDAGEATYGLLKRKFGCERQGTAAAAGSTRGEDVDAILRNLRCLFISHIHADHHIGLIRILIERRKLQPRPEQPLYLVGTTFVHSYLREYSRIEDFGLDDDVVLLNNEFLDFRTGVDPLPEHVSSGSASSIGNGNGGGMSFAEHSRQLHHDLNSSVKTALNLSHIHTARVDHRGSHCYGLVLRYRSGFSFTYSGDTRPCSSLISAGHDTTLLIHEATLEDSQRDMAIAKGHSTFGEAIEVGRKMRASNLLLTHFSQRYPKMARSSLFAAGKMKEGEAQGEREMPIALAFDLVTYPLSAFKRIQGYTPALEMLFAADFEDGEEGSVVGVAEDEEGGGGVRGEGKSMSNGGQKQEGHDALHESTTDMDVDRSTQSHLPTSPSTTTNTTATATATKSTNASPSLRKSFKPSNYAYIQLRFTTPTSTSTTQASLRNAITPSLINVILRSSLDQLLGLVGGSIPFDILSIVPCTTGDVEVIFRLDTIYANDTVTALTIHPDLDFLPLLTLPQTQEGQAGSKVRVSYHVSGPSASLIGLEVDKSRQFPWRDE